MPEFNIRKELTHIRYYLDLLKQGAIEKEEKRSKNEDNRKQG